MSSLTISGLTNEWNALNHLQTWVSKNAKSYFGSEKYLKAEGCVRDGLVTLGSVKLGSMEGSVSDGSGFSCAVSLRQIPGMLTATCDCFQVKLERFLVKQEETEFDAPPSCHHLAAFLLWAVDADNKGSLSPFVCGGTASFNYKGYLATYKSREQLIEMLDQRSSTCELVELLDGLADGEVRRAAEVSSIKDAGGDVTVVRLMHDIYAVVDNAASGAGARMMEEGDLGDEICRLLCDNIKPHFITHPEDVTQGLCRLIECLHRADLSSFGGSSNAAGFNTDALCRQLLDFILSQPGEHRPQILKKFMEADGPYEKSATVYFKFIEVLCGNYDAEDVGRDLIPFLLGDFIFCRQTSQFQHLLLQCFKSMLSEERYVQLVLSTSSLSSTIALELVDKIVLDDPRNAIAVCEKVLNQSAGGTVVRHQTALHVSNMEKLFLARVELATRMGGSEGVLRWLIKGVRWGLSGSSFLKKAVATRPDKKTELEFVFAPNRPNEYVKYLVEANDRWADLSVYISRNKHRVRDAVLIDYLKRIPPTERTFIGAKALLLRTLQKTISDNTPDETINILRLLHPRFPNECDQQIQRIRTSYAGRTTLLDAIDQAIIIVPTQQQEQRVVP